MAEANRQRLHADREGLAVVADRMEAKMGCLLLSLSALSAAATMPAGDVAQIRALRGQSNAAVAAHAYQAMRRFFLPDYTILPGSSGRPFTADEMATRIAGDFNDPEFVTYVRTPTRIIVSDRRQRAAEVGRWTGTWRKAGGTMVVTGIYQATWNPTPAGWRLKNESFVTLACRGHRDCAKY